jgi:hypothetical protein
MSEPRDLIEDIRDVRRRLWLEHGGTAQSVCDWLRSLDSQHPETLGVPPPRTLGDEEIDEIVRTFGG